jgi:Uma2 family endonuclease
MATTARRKEMTVDEFLVWCLDQDQRYEFVDGYPVPLRAMSGARDEHDAVVVNLIVALGNQLKGSSCRPKTADTAVRTKIKRIRRPDVTIECAPVELGSLEARNPVAVFEVLSPPTREIDRTEKMHEYQRHPALMTIVQIDPKLMDVLVLTRSPDGTWEPKRLERPDHVIMVVGTSVALSLSTVYDGVPVEIPAPRADD